MLTQDPNAIRLDCLCYLMHRIGMDGRRPVGAQCNLNSASTIEISAGRMSLACATNTE